MPDRDQVDMGSDFGSSVLSKRRVAAAIAASTEAPSGASTEGTDAGYDLVVAFTAV